MTTVASRALDPPTGLRSAAADGAARAAAALAGLQHADGWWKGELETNVSIDAEDLLLRQFLGIRTADQTAATARWIRAHQRDDGTWANFFEGPPELSTSVEAYAALRLAGDPADAEHMVRAAAYITGAGGVAATRVFTRIWLALFGLWPWDALPVLPPELMYLPPWAPLNIYDFGCWARQTVVALTVVGTHRPVRDLGITLDELSVPAAGRPPRARWRSVADATTTWGGRFAALDRLLHRYERHPLGPLRRRALARAERWIVQRQEADGSWGGIQPPWVYSLIALHLQGYALDHPVMAAGLAGLDAFTVTDDAGRRLEACQSPVWDTALAVTALADAGAAPDDPALVRAATWILGEEITVPGDWSVRRPDLAPGGWAFEFANDWYPDVDDTAEVVLALGRAAVDATGPLERGVAWTLGMQCADGGWAAFDVDNTRALCRELPFCDFGELIDPPSADVTAHVVEMLAARGLGGRPLERGVAWLLEAQEADGSWFGRWGANHVYGTGAAVPALVAAGVDPGHRAVRAARAWLAEHQNEDGGWGEDLRSYRDPAARGRGPSTASQTAWALLALVAAGDDGPTTERGVRFLLDTQQPDGTWDEPYFTGTGFPGDFYINYHLYRLVFPLSALGRFASDGAVADLVVVSALRIEARSVRGRVERCGVGPEKAAATGARLGVSLGPGTAVVVAGVAGGLDPSLSPGQLVVATELWSTDGRPPRRLAGAGLLADELRRAGLTVRTGPLVSSPVLVTNGHRADLAATGALAVDMESAFFARALADAGSGDRTGSDGPGAEWAGAEWAGAEWAGAEWAGAEWAGLGGRPLAVVRAVADTSTHSMATGGIRALGSLRRIRPALERWAAALAPRQVVLAAPRSFCAGVERAIEIVDRAIDRFGAPVYVRRQIVHNAHVVRRLEARGAVFVEELDQVPPGATVVLAAHGVSPEVRRQADDRGDLAVIDATCPLVAKVHHEARRFAAQGLPIVLVGHGDHEEVVGTLGEAPDHMTLVERPEDVDRLELDPGAPVAYLTQTTLATDETADVVAALEQRFPRLTGPSAADICYATQNRQEAVRAMAGRCDLLLVVGSANSSNTARLVEVARRQGCRAELVEDAAHMRLDWLGGATTVGLTAGASAPESLVQEVVDVLRELGEVSVTEVRTTDETARFTLPPQVR